MSQLNELNLAERLNKLSYNGVFDRELNDYFYGIRKIGNKAAHEDVENELMLALQVHEYVYKITGWFIETYVNYNFKTPIYKSPKPQQNIDEKENNRLISKFMEKFSRIENILSINSHRDNKVDKEIEELNHV